MSSRAATTEHNWSQSHESLLKSCCLSTHIGSSDTLNIASKIASVAPVCTSCDSQSHCPGVKVKLKPPPSPCNLKLSHHSHNTATAIDIHGDSQGLIVCWSQLIWFQFSFLGFDDVGRQLLLLLSEHGIIVSGSASDQASRLKGARKCPGIGRGPHAYRRII